MYIRLTRQLNRLHLYTLYIIYLEIYTCTYIYICAYTHTFNEKRDYELESEIRGMFGRVPKEEKIYYIIIS